MATAGAREAIAAKGRRYTLGVLVAIGMLAGWSVAVVAQAESAAPQVPVDFTGHVVCGDQVRPFTPGTGGGDNIIVRTRRGAWHPSGTMSDPRLQGDCYISYDDDEYVSPAGSSMGTGTWRIENEEGAWQGSYAVLGIGDRSSVVTAPLVGEGAYEGLTAVWESAYDPVACDWEVWGLIIEGDVPAAPEPFTGP